MDSGISVIITSHNSDELLSSALDSVYQQSMRAAEVLIVDDASMVPTEELLALYPASPLILSTNLYSQGAATNFGISKSRGELIALLDHDDYWPLNKLEWQYSLLLASGADVVVGAVVNEWINCDGGIKREDMGIARLFGSCLIHRRAFEIVGPLDQSGNIHEVIEWWSRANGQLKVVTDPRVALYRRIHGRNMTMAAQHQDRSALLARIRSHIENMGS